jgi:Holliday junction DNA helicase RuvA
MFGHIRGIVHSKGPGHLVVETHGLGYHIQVPIEVAQKCKVESEVFIYLHHHFVADPNRSSESLYGFLEAHDRKLFRLLISVKGIGPRQALSMLSSCSTPDLVRNIENSNADFLKHIKGIGSKTAQRLLLELKDKISDIGLESSSKSSASSSVSEDAIAALVSLGYRENESRKAVEKTSETLEKEIDVAELVRRSLQQL